MKELLGLLGALDKTTLIASRLDRLWARLGKLRAAQAQARASPGPEAAPAPPNNGEEKMAREALRGLGYDAPTIERLITQVRAANAVSWARMRAEEIVGCAIQLARRK